MDEHQKFKVQVTAFLEGLPPDSGLSYKAIMRKVKARHVLPPSRVTKAPQNSMAETRKPKIREFLNSTRMKT
jgi:hypothetical protein